MESPVIHLVTGALGYTGKYITRRLLESSPDVSVRTLTAHPDRPNPFGSRISVFPFNFDNPDELRDSLKGVDTLYNTYWVRFSYKDTSFQRAVDNTRVLIRAAAEAGVRRFVHLSITNPSEDSHLPYFRGKAQLERALSQSGLSYAIIRPTVVFGKEDILINNIAWFLRHVPVFLVPGSGEYRLQPVFVEDLAQLAVRSAAQAGNMVVDAVGPEVCTFNQIVRLLAAAVESRARIIHAPAGLALFVTRVLGFVTDDVVLTKEELEGLSAGLLVSNGPPTCPTPLSEWLDRNAATLGSSYASELRRHYR